MSFLQIEDVTHSYFSKQSKTTALIDVSLTIEEGEFISFLGPSGCGKTTLLSIISGLIHPTIGRVIIDHEEVHDSNNKTGYMLQQDYLFPWRTIEDNILLGLRLTKQLNVKTKQKTIALLEEMGLKHVLKQFPTQLSGGMRQRVALVRTLATNPKLLLLDEPFSALDFQTKLKLEDLVFATLKQFQKTAILVTHDIGEAIAMSDRIYLFSNRPGTIHKIFDISAELKSLTPFRARNHELYNHTFQEIWKELESLEQTNEN
ncbi:ABC transporter ATP-binding protein [Bacillus andreraoultii]|uniref:ABC transporter ATP-binding protein n=1 Tax=Bacillus andreraoultii TaxID=1499685 RepID=UPI000539E274|nr:ABC transporter ATP-binding protein [Bacillus andreraoultii]